MCRSVRQTPQAWTSSSSWPAAGSGLGRSRGWSGCFGASSTMARIGWSVTSKGMAFGPLVSSEWLLDHLGQRDVVVVDCRFVLGSPGAGRSAWEEAHIPTAHFLDVDEALSAPAEAGGAGGTAGGGAGFPSGGRHPLPAAADFAVAA